MPLQSTSGAASYDAFGGGVAVVPKYIEDYFSTFLYQGTGSSQTINNGIDLATKGGLVWFKSRSGAYNHALIDTARGGGQVLSSNTTSAQADYSPQGISAFNTNGFTFGTTTAELNNSSNTYTSWSWAKAPKFFDVVTYTGTGSTQTIAHNLGSVPGSIIVKATSGSTTNWAVYHRSLGGTGALLLNQTFDTQVAPAFWNDTDPTSTVFTVSSSSATNSNGVSYVAYLFAHNAGGFGLTGTDNVISCGSYSGTGATGNAITLGYEPQWVMVKRTDSTADWVIMDAMRTGFLEPNTSDAESGGSWFSLSGDNFFPTATGFQINTAGPAWNASGGSYIYIAIRRGPMKVPTSGTSVFYPQAISQADNIDSTGVPFPPDLVNTFSRNGTGRSSTELFQFVDRLRGLGTPNNTFTASAPRLVSSDTSAENTGSSYVQLKADSQNITRGTGWNSASYGNWIDYFWRRAPSFFDEVCYTGTGTYGATNHNLGVTPELVIYKSRSNSVNWGVIKPVSSIAYYDGLLNSNSAFTYYSNDPSVAGLYTSTQFAKYQDTSSYTYVAYLFATCAGVSKVGSYTGNGTTQTINCGFGAGGARFVLIKRTDASGGWYVYDTLRGMTTLTNHYLFLNSDASQTATLGSVTTVSTGFALDAAVLAAINTNAASYIFLAIA